MKWVQLLCFSILLPCLIAEKRCYKNDVRKVYPEKALVTSTCGSTNDECFCGVGVSSGGDDLIERGCTDICNQERTVSYKGKEHNLAITCCLGNTCNLCPPKNGQSSAANGLHLSMAVALVVGVVNVCMW